MSSRNLEYASEDDVLSLCTASSVTKCLLILVPKKASLDSILLVEESLEIQTELDDDVLPAIMEVENWYIYIYIHMYVCICWMWPPHSNCGK